MAKSRRIRPERAKWGNVMSFRYPVLLVAAHGTQHPGSVPGGMFCAQLQRLLPGFDIRLAFLRNAPTVGNVLQSVSQEPGLDVLLFPLFFARSSIVSDELPALTSRAGLEPHRLLPSASYLPGFVNMLANRVITRLASGGNSRGDGEKTAVFLVSHGQKRETCSSPEMCELRNSVAQVLTHHEIHNVQLDGQPSLADWRDLTNCRKALFVPLFAGDGLHCRQDIPDGIDVRPGEIANILAPVGTWQELSSLLVDHLHRCHAHSVAEGGLPRSVVEWGADHVTA